MLHRVAPYDCGMRRVRINAIDLVDVFVYLVVLATFTQLFPRVLSESFLTSLATAVLLKLVLEIVVRIKKWVVRRIKAANTRPGRVVTSGLLVLVAAGSKALILWLTDLLFGDAVYLGGFLSVTLLVIVLMLARRAVRSIVA